MWTVEISINYELEAEIAGSGKEEKLSSIRDVMSACTFSYTRQNQMLGLGHAIACGRTLVGHQPFGVILADDLCMNDGGGAFIMFQGKVIKGWHYRRC